MTDATMPDHASTFDPTPTFSRSLQELLARADAGLVPSGVLVTVEAAPFGGGPIRDGLNFADTVDQRQWETIYTTLAKSRMAHAEVAFAPLELPPMAPLEPEPVRIGLLHMHYHQPTRRLAGRILRALKDDAEIEVPAGPPLELRTAFAASALLPWNYWGFERQPDIHEGLDVVFHLDPAWMISNCAAADRIEMDFDDGEGFREMAVGGMQTVHYDQGGRRRVVLRAWYGTEPRMAAFHFRAEPKTAPEPDDAFVVTAKIPHERVLRRCRVVVYLGEGNTKITRPMLLAEGFPGGAVPSALYDRINGKSGERFNPDARLADAVRKQGYDLLLLFFEQGGAELQGNAYAYLAALQEIWKRMGETGEIVATGGSMGGLIARYALAYAEQRSEPTGNVTALITFDSPHEGANVPLGVQCNARFFAEDAPAQNRLLDLMAAKQMLVAQQWVRYEKEVWSKKAHKDFYTELGTLADHGYPSKIKKYAVSNGAGDGTMGIRAGTPGVQWRHPWNEAPCVKGEAWGAANGGKGSVAWCARPFQGGWECPIEGYFSRDGVAGGTATFFGDLATAFRNVDKPEVREHVTNASFVPSYSSLGYRIAPTADAQSFKGDALKPGDTKFTAWHVSRTNMAHATMDKGIKDFVLKLLERPGVERRLFVSCRGRTLSGNFRAAPFKFELLRPDQRLPVALAGHTLSEDAETLVLKVMQGDAAWYVSDQPVRGSGVGQVLLLVRDPSAAVRLTPVFDSVARTVAFRRPGLGTALTFLSAGVGVGFAPVMRQNEPHAAQYFEYADAP